MSEPIRVTVWSENRHEKRDELVARLYPDGMHGAVKAGIEENLGDKASVRMELGPVKWSGRVRVVTCDALEDDGHVLGCEFVANELSRRRTDAA